MAITSYEYVFDKNGQNLSCLKYSTINPSSSTKMSCITTSSLTSNNKYNKTKIDNYISPYISDDRIQLLSRVTKKRFLHDHHDLISSFPLAVNMYKANSDDLRSSKRFSKKVKKSVLTLPNEPTPLPQACTVSDMNDSEYFNDDKVSTIPKQKKKRLVQSRNKSRVPNRQIDVYETNAKNYSQLGSKLNKNSKDVLNFTGGDAKKFKGSPNNSTTVKSNYNAHDVWTLLRNVNHFKFVPSSPVSHESSVISLKKKKKRKNSKLHNTRKDTRFFETCRTEEFAYISSFVDSSRNSCSQSSFDRITVIEKQDQIENITCNGVEKQIEYPTNSFRYHSRTENMQNDRSKKSKITQSNLKRAIHSIKNNDKINNNKKLLPAIQSNNVTYQNNNKQHQKSEIVQQNSFESIQNNLMKISLSNKVDIHQNNINCFSNQCNISEKSDSSKEGIRKFKSKMIPSNNVLEKLNRNDSQEDVTGITKVVLTKGQKTLLTKQIAALQRKSRTTTPVKLEKPKISLTLSEIKRKIRSIKFPLVILTKDQLSSTFRVENYDPPQFAGLDEHIWPFMRSWNGKSNKNLLNSSINKTNYYSNFDSEAWYTNEHYTKVCSLKNKNSILPINEKEKSLTRIKPMHMIKNRMMKFMHKKNSHDHEFNKYNIISKQTVDIGVNTLNDLSSLKRENTEIRKTTNKTSTGSSFKKTKGKWASDFIETVIHKIKNGIYYSHDDKEESRDFCNDMKEDGVQTDIEDIRTAPISDFIKETKKDINEIDTVVPIPGFSKRFLDLKIETLNHFNRVEVKHCVANIIVQFDVELSFESNRALQIKQSHPFVPVSLGQSEPTIFKCKTSIINSILPAELCTILPSIMEKIIRSNSKLTLPSLTNTNNTNLPTITEITRCESDLNKNSIPVHIGPKSTINIVREGNFAAPYSVKTVKKDSIQSKPSQLLDWTNIKEILTLDNINLLFSDFRQIKLINYSTIPTPKPAGDIMQNTERAPSKILQPYQFSEKMIITMRENYTFMRIVENILNSQKFNVSVSHNCNFKVILYKDSLHMNVVSPDNNRFNLTVPNVKLSHLHNDFDTYYTPKVMLKSFCASKLDKRKSTIKFCVNTKTKKRSFVKLYQKCKSMSNISTNKSSTNLNKITNIENFYLALGSGKMLSGVLDGNVEKNILLSIKMMKNWISEITPRQALLVLMLANKKDTINLVLYRSLILQGIAVNRITQSSELDMEIEVIERENLNKLPKYEGITYLPASEENQDTLLKELCWIAKTTASDYQKPFDESSERLLKSLLEKRKKLNPSYLRVMARYVGLGLLKTSK